MPLLGFGTVRSEHFLSDYHGYDNNSEDNNKDDQKDDYKGDHKYNPTDFFRVLFHLHSKMHYFWGILNIF